MTQGIGRVRFIIIYNTKHLMKYKGIFSEYRPYFKSRSCGLWRWIAMF